MTKDNSHYLNFDFDRKKNGINEKGEKISEYYYANSDIRQERKIAQDFEDWTVESCKKRREELEKFIVDKWGIDKFYSDNIEEFEEINEEDDNVVFNDID